MLLRRTACEEVGWLDEELVFGYDDTEVCWRMQRAGWGVYFLSEARVIHHQEKSTGDGFNPYVYMRSRIGLVRVTRKYYPPLVRLILPWWVVAGVGVEAAFSFLNEDRERTKGCIETMRECIRVLS